MKKNIFILMIILALVTFVGCKKTVDTANTKVVISELNAEKIVTSNFGKSDALFSFKLKETKIFLSKYYKINALLDPGYIEKAPTKGFVNAKDQSQLKFTKEIENNGKGYQYIKKFSYGLYFNDGSKDQLTFNELYLTLCDDNKDGKIGLNDKSKNMLKDVYSKIDLVKMQTTINQSLAGEKKKTDHSIKLQTNDKYCVIHVDWYRNEKNQVEVTIHIQQFEHYPKL